MPTPIVVQHNEWKDLLRALKDNPTLSFISTAPVPVQKLVLAAPLAISFFIVHYAQELCSLDRIKILVIGAEWIDALDNGRWYQSIADFCDARFHVEASLVGPDVFEEKDRQSTLSSMVRTIYPEAVIIRSRLEDAQIDLSLFDLYVFFEQSIECRQRLWMKGALPHVVKTGKPIMAAYSSRDAYAKDVSYLEACGCAVEGEPTENPFPLQLQGGMSGAPGWGRLLYKI